MTRPIPVILFAYARPYHLTRTVACLHENRVPVIYAFSDGPKGEQDAPLVQAVREILSGIDWCTVFLNKREDNFGLGRSIRDGVTDVLSREEMCIVFEDDLICVPGTYEYLCAALNHYRNDPRVMSVTGWTHPNITPDDDTDQPYFDGRAECWVWGTWARAWQGMDQDARTLMNRCRDKRIDVYRYGADLVQMAETELERNIWAVRLLYHHILNRGLCLRPPWSMIEHIGFGAHATNARDESWIRNPPLRPHPTIPSQWPEPLEHRQCARLHQKVCGRRPTTSARLYHFARAVASKAFRSVTFR